MAFFFKLLAHIQLINQISKFHPQCLSFLSFLFIYFFIGIWNAVCDFWKNNSLFWGFLLPREAWKYTLFRNANFTTFLIYIQFLTSDSLWGKCCAEQSERKLYLKTQVLPWGCGSVVVGLPGMHKALVFNPQLHKKTSKQIGKPHISKFPSNAFSILKFLLNNFSIYFIKLLS